MQKLNNLSKKEWGKYNRSVWKCSSNNGYFASFDEEIPERLIKYFTFPGDKILDPFVGSGTTLEVAARLKRNAIGLDCSEKAIKIANQKVTEENDLNIKAIKGDSRDLSNFKTNEFDFIITSPPYFDIVNYSSDSYQLGNISNYNDFLSNIFEVFKTCKRVLKTDKYLAIVTADIRKSNHYYPLHIDYINEFKKLGIKLHQILINIFQPSGKEKRENCMGYPSNFHPWMEHEYILIFQS